MTRGGVRKGAGRPPTGDARGMRVMLRLSDDEYDAIEASARAANKLVSTWIRETCLRTAKRLRAT